MKFPVQHLVLTATTLSLHSLAAADDKWVSLHNGGNTSVQCENLPIRWSPTDGIAWSAALPGYGQSSPVVWKRSVYVTQVEGDYKERCHVLALAADTGKVLWKREIPASVRQKNSYMVSRAAPTPVVDGDGVYCFFAGGDLVAFTHRGKKRWHRTLFDKDQNKFQNVHGYGGSPAQTADAVILLVDHRGPSYLTAISKKSGETLWKTSRTARSSWTSPQVTRVAGQEQVVVSSNGSVDGYDAKTGERLWSHQGLTGNTICSATVQGDQVFVGAAVSQRQTNASAASESNCCIRITPDQEQGYQLLWKAEKALCHYVSPLVHDGYAYYINKVGAVFCLDAKTGEQRAAKRVSGPCWAQPIACGEHIYLFHKTGETTVLQAGPEMKVVAVNRLWNEDSPPVPKRDYDYQPQGPDDNRSAKPPNFYMDPLVYAAAAVDGAILVRIGTHLLCVRRPDASPSP